jgi:hypothetical protein
MAKGKDAPEMFEAFLGAKKEPKPLKSSVPKNADESSGSAASKRPQPSWYPGVVDSDDVNVMSLGERTQVVFALSYNALIIIIMAFVVLMFSVYFFGHARGARSGSSTNAAAVTPAGLQGETPNGQPQGPGQTEPTSPEPNGERTTPPVPEVVYSVKLLTVDNVAERRQALANAINQLERRGIRNIRQVPTARGTKIELWAGLFTSRAEAETEKEVIRRLTVAGRNEFRDAMVLRAPQE